MKYLIESKLFYNAESGELIYIDIGVTEKHQLTKTANHILAILMASHGKVVSRQSFLEQVWESRGHEASNSSLNQYISILRKKLSFLIRKDNIILTSPGVGFYLSKDIKVKRYDDSSRGRTTFRKITSATISLPKTRRRGSFDSQFDYCFFCRMKWPQHRFWLKVQITWKKSVSVK